MSIRSPPTPNASTRPTSNINNILNPTSVFDRDARKFLSSRACERQTDVVDDRDLQEQEYDYHRAKSPVSVASSNGSRGNYESDRYSSPRHRGSAGVTLPPINRGEYDHYSTQKQYAAEIGRSATAVPVGHSSSIYPSSMLPSKKSPTHYGHSRESSSDYQRHMAHHARPPSSLSGITTSSASSTASSMSSTLSSSSQDPESPIYGSPRGSGYSTYRTTNGHSGNGYPNYNEYARGTTNGSSRHSHSQSYSTSAYATDHKPSKLVPTRHSTGGSVGGRGGVGPANLPPVLPRPPNTSGRRGTIGRSSLSMSVSRSGRVDDDDMVAQAVNTYRQSGPIVDL